MIISASYKTDIPTFYGEWLMNRIRAGFCRMSNPYNRKQRFNVSLRKEDVDGFVFWTKNVEPFIDALHEVHELGYPFILQYTINAYPRALESRVIDSDNSVRSFRTVSNRFGTKTTVWRYDTIIFSTLTNADFHRVNFARLARALAGSTDEVVVSFMQLYGKTLRNMNKASDSHDFKWEDPSTNSKKELLKDLVETASIHGMRLAVCTQPDLMVPGAVQAKCIDVQRLMEVSGHPIRSKPKGMRPGCGCAESRDIGEYDTCPHGCVYCYAVRHRSVALERFRRHDPQGEYLFPQQPQESGVESKGPAPQTQLPLLPKLEE